MGTGLPFGDPYGGSSLFRHKLKDGQLRVCNCRQNLCKKQSPTAALVSKRSAWARDNSVNNFNRPMTRLLDTARPPFGCRPNGSLAGGQPAVHKDGTTPAPTLSRRFEARGANG